METKAPVNKSLKMMAFSALFYGICSGSMNFANKFLLNTWLFDQAGFILVIQLLMNIVALKILQVFKKVDLVPYTYATAKSCIGLSCFYSANTLLALFALSGMNVPMYVALRRCVPVASLLIGKLAFSKQPGFLVILSVAVLTTGTIVAGAGDLQFEMKSYLMGSASCLLMAAYLNTLQYIGNVKQISSTSLLYINSINCVPLIAIMSTKNFFQLSAYPHWNNPQFLCSFAFVVFLGCLLNYSMFLCTTTNSAIVTACVGVVKSGFVSILGFFFFGGVTPTPLFVSGLLVNFGGGALLTYAKYKQALSDKVT